MTKTIHKIAIIKASPVEVFERWTTNEGSIQFFASKCNIELKVGGAYEQYFLLDNPKGEKGSEGCKVLSYVPDKMFSFSWNAPPHIPEVRNHQHKAWIVVLLSEVDGDTQVDLYHTGFLKGKAWDDTYNYFINAWDIVLNNLSQSFSDEEED